MTSIERHIQQTNERLNSIREALATATGFQTAGRELLDWCGDSRAFQKAFEHGLLACLDIISKVAAKEGYDLDLGYRLLAICAAQRERFSPNSAGLLSVWCEELGRLLLLRHQKERNSGGPSEKKGPFAMHQALHKHQQHGPQSYLLYENAVMGGGEWHPNLNSTPGNSAQNQQQQVSVVTTVWGVTTSTPSGPLAHSSYGGANTTMAQTPYSTGQQSYPGTMVPKPYSPALMNARQNNSNYNNYLPNASGMAGPSPNHNGNDYNQQSLGTAALVAAAATATATATASVVALQERSPSACNQYGQAMQGSPYQPVGYDRSVGNQRLQSNQQLNNGMSTPIGGAMSGGMNTHMTSNLMPISNSVPPITLTSQCPVGMNGAAMNRSGVQTMTGGSVQQPPSGLYNSNTPAMASTRSRSNYPAPQQHMTQKRPNQYVVQQYGPSMPHYSAGPQHAYNTSQYQTPTQPRGQQYGVNVSPQPINNYLSQPQMRPASLRAQAPPYQPQQYYSQSQINGGPPNSFEHQPAYGAQYGAQNMQRNLSYQPSPIPGNPTPPLTPASGIPPYLSPNPDLKPSFPDMKPSLPAQKDDELRLTFPVRDGVILAPFRLEHNLAVSNHVFHLKPSVHQTLTWRTDLELQLKCFHHEDRQMNTNWPASVQVSVNATPLCIDRGENKTSHKPLYLKDVCQQGRNTIQITVTACCCSHLFLLQLVHRPTVRSVLQGLLRKRLLPAEHCIQKIKRNFTTGAVSTNNAISVEDGVEQTAIKVSLKCPITFKRITLPARGQECKHIQGFDLESYLQLNSERGAWRCPVCNKAALLEGLEVDQYIWGILTNLSNSDVEEVTIDATASWKPVPVKTIKEEHDGEICNSTKRFKAMSPNSMTMPTTSTWEIGQGLSPYSSLPPPDMQSISNGPIMSNGANYNTGNSGFDFQSQASDFSSPLSHLSESVSSLDPLAAMEKTLIHHEQQMGPPNLHDQSSSSLRHVATTTPSSTSAHHSQPATPSSQSQGVMPHGPNTPHTPHTPHTPGGGPPSVPPSTQQTSDSNVLQQNGHAPTNADHSTLSHAPDLSDLNFDPAAVIDGEGQGQEGLNLLPESVDPMELLSYLDPPDLSAAASSNTNATSMASSLPTSSSVTATSTNSASDDLLALFET